MRIQSIGDDVARAFADVNTLLNDLAEGRAADAGALRKRLQQAPLKLTTSLKTADDQLAQAPKTFAAFAPVIKASKKVAEQVAGLLRKLVIPVFPTHERLGACAEFISRPMYEDLSGAQVFALLNILARLMATELSGRRLLEGRGVGVTHVFPDRIYFEADRSIILDLEADAESDRPSFERAPASLHRFKEGSFKQTTFRKGNLQVSFATRPRDRVVIDADIDLYRAVVPHLFGEVLVNHLTGNTTDQYAVRRILDDQSVSAIGGFQLLQV